MKDYTSHKMTGCREEWPFKNGTCSKLTISKGDIHERPKDNTACEVTVTINSGGHIECGNSEYLKNKVNLAAIGDYDGEMDKQIDKCLQTMVPGEECLLSFKFNEFPSTVDLDIILKGFTQATDTFKWSREDKLKFAKEQKQKGVQLFQGGKLSESFYRFNKSAKLLISLDVKSDAEAAKIYVQVCNNMAWCHLKQGSSIHALTLCNKVLSIEPSNVKALLRRSEVYTRVNDIQSAVLDLREAKKLEPNNGVARERLVLLQHRLDLENIKYNNVIKRMFQ